MGETFSMEALKALIDQVPNLVALIYLVRMFIRAHKSQLESSERMEERHRNTMLSMAQESAARETHYASVVEKNTQAFLEFSHQIQNLTKEK